MTWIWLLPHSIKPDMNKEHQQWGKSTICQVPSWVADIIAIFQKCHCRQVGGNANSLIEHDFHSAVTCWPTLCICCSTLVNKQGTGGVITLSKCSRFILTLNISRFFFFPPYWKCHSLPLHNTCTEWISIYSDTPLTFPCLLSATQFITVGTPIT